MPLHLISDDELRARAMSAVAKLVALCFKHARTSPDFMALLGRWMDVVREVVQAPNGLASLAQVPNGLASLAQVLCYILRVSEHVEREALKALLAREIGPETEEAIVTAGQLLIEQGRQQGREEGREEGRLRLQEVLLQLLRQRFGAQVDSHVEQRVAEASIEQVETWTRRVLSAASLSELFAN